MENVKTGKGLAAAGLVMGIVAIVLFWLPVWNTLSLVCGIVGIACSVAGKKQAVAAGVPTGLATAGLVLSIIGTVFGAIGFLSCTLCVLCAAGEFAALCAL